MERVVDTSNKFTALLEEGDNRNDQCNDQSNDQCNDVDPPSMASPDQCNDHCNDVDSSTTASPDHSLWHSKIKTLMGSLLKGSPAPRNSLARRRRRNRLQRKARLIAPNLRKTLVANSVFKDWDMIDNYNSHSPRRIWVGWDPRILNITKISETDQIIHCNACILDTNDQFQISFVYGSNDDRLSKALWQSMCSSQHGSPWIVLGDFNVSRSVGESIGGCSRISGAMEEFKDCLQSSELDDLCFSDRADFLPLVYRCWREQVHGTMQYKLWSKLRNLKKVLKTLNNDKHYIGNGSRTSLWFDDGQPDSPLLSKWSPRVVYDSGLPIHATVSSIVHGDSWSWPAAMSIDLFEIRSRMPSYNPNSNVNDRARWLPSSNGTYYASFALASLRTPHPFVPWFKLVWFPQNIPRMSFIL
ncbi:hypothetical protein Dsin_029095 [Dipteronia sinensis]|uniref:Exo_endo_phos domain-containing protein n=1 Tax=Dipteronia sinensis TaxID=43782 RepID=A0AAE0DV76_9ROSI|nr:hypothetical protein Dsin_029095 [Dipteronia sinensis]